MSDTQDYISSELKRLDLCTTIKSIKTLSGGCISQASCYSTDKGDYFIKTNANKKASQWFRAESLALERMNETVPDLVPKPIYHATENKAFIVTEYIPMTNNRSSEAQKNLGHALATLHASSSSQKEGKFGFDVVSWCGTTELDNAWCSNWCEFYRSQRLLPLLEQVRGDHADVDRLGNSLCSRLDHWLGQDALGQVQPSLLHGDLWSGNWAVYASEKSKPIIFDPASFYGHYEAEHGIMKMFGGFSQDCFDAYDDALAEQDHIPVSPSEGRQDRLMIYEAYHHLNHFAMFGGSYASGFINLMEQLL
ncbi:Fructosamine/Ketosamine-3-kinase [Gilbertella persicaria]|uniref:Fructosamine/Ketosamine-3-kinase n=1 Tax=Gilbertella persicaria TaxID=101096 RepID=UPI00221E6DAA|nr:Fructosamine/Ketosamine-3-kinase [Gilbertella persicaria]KAI8056332.1 Fructosamine/Ketosamine-3-kinase [Gilbertella persicaria]